MYGLWLVVCCVCYMVYALPDVLRGGKNNNLGGKCAEEEEGRWGAGKCENEI